MTFRPPLYLQNSDLFSYSAADDRFLIDTLFAEGIMNVAAGQGLAVQRPDGANMQVYVPAFDAIIDGDDAALQGAYLLRMTAAEYVTVTGAPGTGSRIDLLVVEVIDSAYRTVNTAAPEGPRLRVIAGTAAASSPAVPAVPATAIPLAQITVAAGQTTIVTANITDRRTQSGAATLQIGTTAVPLTTTQRLALNAPVTGYLVFDTSLGKLFTYGGAILGWVAGLLDIQTFTTSGTWTKPPGAALCTIFAVGGGGGGGQVTGSFSAGGGGGEGVRTTLSAAQLGATESVTVGAAGAANTSGGKAGDSTFGTWVRALGGASGFGIVAAPGGGATVASTSPLTVIATLESGGTSIAGGSGPAASMFGGGAGGNATNTPSYVSGGASGGLRSATGGGAANSAGAGAAGTSRSGTGRAGDGGGAGSTAGGNGGVPGGGGGASPATPGLGARGEVIVFTICI